SSLNARAITISINGNGESQSMPHVTPHDSSFSGRALDQVRLTVAPLRFGAGIKGKVLDSLAAGVPCVMTPIASEGLSLTDELKKLVAIGNANMAKLIVLAHTDRNLFNQNSKAGQSYIRNHHHEQCVTKTLHTAFIGPSKIIKTA
ncbi:glycosyltransferase, partial [Acetobacter farinalis]